MGAREWYLGRKYGGGTNLSTSFSPPYLSWPAVSQISNLTVVSSRQTVCVRKAAPIVDSCVVTKISSSSWNSKENFNLELVELSFYKAKNQRRLSNCRLSWKNLKFTRILRGRMCRAETPTWRIIYIYSIVTHMLNGCRHICFSSLKLAHHQFPETGFRPVWGPWHRPAPSPRSGATRKTHLTGPAWTGRFWLGHPLVSERQTYWIRGGAETFVWNLISASHPS